MAKRLKAASAREKKEGEARVVYNNERDRRGEETTLREACSLYRQRKRCQASVATIRIEACLIVKWQSVVFEAIGGGTFASDSSLRVAIRSDAL